MDCSKLDDDSPSEEGQRCAGSRYQRDILGEAGCLHKLTERVTPETQQTQEPTFYSLSLQTIPEKALKFLYEITTKKTQFMFVNAIQNISFPCD